MKKQELETALFRLLCDMCNDHECEIEELEQEYNIDRPTIIKYKKWVNFEYPELAKPKSYNIYYSKDFGKTWEECGNIKTNSIENKMNTDCEKFGEDWLFDKYTRIARNSYGNMYAYLTQQENIENIKNKIGEEK